MTKKFDKKAIQEALKAELNKTVITEAPRAFDAVKGMAAGVGNMFSNIGGQYKLGKINNQLKNTSDRIKIDWKKAEDVATKLATKLGSSGNPNIKRAGAQAATNLKSASQDIQKATGKLDQLAGSGVDQPGMDGGNLDLDPDNDTEWKQETDEFGNKITVSPVQRWIKSWGGDLNDLSKADHGRITKQFMNLKSAGLNPFKVPQDKVAAVLAQHEYRTAQIFQTGEDPYPNNEHLEQILGKGGASAQVQPPQVKGNENGGLSDEDIVDEDEQDNKLKAKASKSGRENEYILNKFAKALYNKAPNALKPQEKVYMNQVMDYVKKKIEDPFNANVDDIQFAVKELQNKGAGKQSGTKQVAQPNQAPTQPVANSAAQPNGIPTMITNAMREKLRAKGMSDADIANLKPEQAHQILNSAAPRPSQPAASSGAKPKLTKADVEALAKGQPLPSATSAATPATPAGPPPVPGANTSSKVNSYIGKVVQFATSKGVKGSKMGPYVANHLVRVIDNGMFDVKDQEVIKQIAKKHGINVKPQAAGFGGGDFNPPNPQPNATSSAGAPRVGPNTPQPPTINPARVQPGINQFDHVQKQAQAANQQKFVDHEQVQANAFNSQEQEFFDNKSTKPSNNQPTNQKAAHAPPQTKAQDQALNAIAPNVAKAPTQQAVKSAPIKPVGNQPAPMRLPKQQIGAPVKVGKRPEPQIEEPVNMPSMKDFFDPDDSDADTRKRVDAHKAKTSNKSKQYSRTGAATHHASEDEYADVVHKNLAKQPFIQNDAPMKLPTHDDGQKVTVGSEQQPGFAPPKSPKKPSSKKSKKKSRK